MENRADYEYRLMLAKEKIEADHRGACVSVLCAMASSSAMMAALCPHQELAAEAAGDMVRFQAAAAVASALGPQAALAILNKEPQP